MGFKSLIKFKETEIGPIPEEWGVVNIDEALNIVDGDRGTNYPNGSDFFDNDYCLFLNAKNVIGDSFDFSNCQFISQAKDSQLRKGKMQRGDFVLTTRGTVGNIAFYDDSISFVNIRINSGMVILRNNYNGFDSKFLFQLLKSWITKKQISELTTGSAQPQLPIKDLKNLKLIKPTLQEQKQIAEILSALDDKIELNRKINANLEKMASALFKKWFVDINDKIGSVVSLGDLIKFEKGRKPKKVFDKYEPGLIPQILINTFDTGKSLFANPDGCVIADERDAIMVMDGGSSGRLEFGYAGVVGSTLARILPTSLITSEFLYFYLKTIEEGIKNGTTGTSIPHTDKEKIRSYQLNLPSSDRIKQFSVIVRDIMSEVMDLRKESLALAELRDMLLPRLMSGKIMMKYEVN